MKYVIALCLLLLLACSDSPAESSPPESTYVPISGNWHGEANHPSNTGHVVVDVLVIDSGGVLTGAGTVRVVNNSYGVSVDGVVYEGGVSITMIANLNTWNFSGEIMGERKIVGHISGSGFNNLNMELAK